MKHKKYLTITNDAIFKVALENCPEALHKLCTVFIEDLKDDKYNPNEIIIEKNELKNIEYKSSTMDIRFEIVNKYSFDLEMQNNKPRYELIDRMIKYHAELIVKSYYKSPDYSHRMCYSLWFLNFVLYEEDSNPIHTIKLEGVKNRAGSITVVEIEKLKNYNDNVWYKLFTESNYSKIRGKDRIMDDLVKEVDSLNKYDSLSYLTSSEYRFIVEQNV